MKKTLDEKKKQELLDYVGGLYKSHLQWVADHGHTTGMSDLEAEVDDSLTLLYLISKGISCEIISKAILTQYYPIADAFSACKSSLVEANAEGQTQWQKKSFHQIVMDVEKAVNALYQSTMGNCNPKTDEFVLLLPVSKMQFLNTCSDVTTQTVRDFIRQEYPKCRVMVLPDLSDMILPDDDDGILWAVAKVYNIYRCVRFHGI